MFKLGALLRSACAFGRGILVLGILLAFGVAMRVVSVEKKEAIASSALSSVFYPLQALTSSVDGYHSVLAQNEVLKEQNARLRLELDNAREGLKELVRLRALVRFDNRWDYPIVTSRVVGKNPGRVVTTLVVNRGEVDGLKVDMPAFSMNGVVGRVSRVAAHHAQIQVILDPSMKFSVMDSRTRTIGFAEPMDSHSLMVTVPTHAGVRAGDTLVTSGLGGIFPKGLGVGYVKEVRKMDLDVISLLVVEPFQEVTELEELFVMEKEPDWVVRELAE